MLPVKIYAIDVCKCADLQKVCTWLLSIGHSICSLKEGETYYRFEQVDIKTLKKLGYNAFSIKPIDEAICFIIARQSTTPPQSVAAIQAY